jgi:Domain of unknown function (DUF4062)
LRRPSFFFSSTIYDFKDIRSALKYFLEQQGCSVLASEYNDFPKPLDKHSYDACLHALNKADYFVLFIGARVGGWYDLENGISITQQEYREAYKLHLQGKLKIISFVRADIWRLRESRKELSAFLENLDLDPGAKDAIRNHPSKIASDATFISSFISEVCRNKETKVALADSTAFPTGNWVHIFENFGDVVDAVQTQAFSGLPIESVILRSLLLRELSEMLRLSLVKTDSCGAISPLVTILRFHEAHEFAAKNMSDPLIEVIVKRWDTLSFFSIHAASVKYNPLILHRALESSAFLTFDTTIGTYKVEPVYDALCILQDEIRRFTSANTSENIHVVFEHAPKGRRPGLDRIQIDTLKLISLLHLLDRWANIIQLTRSIILYLNGARFFMPQLRPRTPILEMEDQLKMERVTDQDLATFIETG